MTLEPAGVRRQALSVGLATALYGISLGAVAVASGLSVLQACLTSLLLFSGGSQFALVGVLGSGGSVWAAVAASSLLGIRNGLYALQINAAIRPQGWRRPAAAQLTIDESTAVSVAQSDDAGRRLGFWLTGLTVYVGWNLMTLLGALIGRSIGDPRTYGLDAAAAAAFLALVWPRLRHRSGLQIAALGAVVDLSLVPVLPAGLPIVAAGAVGLVAGLRQVSR
ncbi:MAG: AzlC family ABC transporter permease [Frankiaceae bacterium]|nr:AzlC family ABC transporter permease [Frankiaceae bacterium]